MEKVKTLTKITMEYKDKVITRYFASMQNFPFLYPESKIIKNEYITNEKEISNLLKRVTVFF